MSIRRYPALRINQGNKILYTFKTKGKEILDFASISRIRRTDDGVLLGYQRVVDKKHVTDIATYLENDKAILPNSIVVCFNEKVSFIPLEDNSDFGFITIPMNDSEKNGSIVDGQQRVTALAQIERDDFEIIVNAFIANDTYEETEQFILVNNIKPLAKPLVYELVPSLHTVVPKQLADKRLPMNLIQELNSRRNSPFYQKIKTHTFPDGIIKDNTIIKALNHSLVEGVLFKYTANIVTGYAEPNIENMLSILFAYWGAVQQVFKNDWKLPPTKTRLTHGAGIIALSFVMEELVQKIGEKEVYLMQDFLPYIEAISNKCAWSSGQWRFEDGTVRESLDIQNVGKDISMLTNYLVGLI